MSGVLTIARRELGAYFSTPLGWICLGAWLLITGFFFGWSMDLYSTVSLQTASSPFGDPLDVNTYLVAPFFGNWAVVLIFLCPALSMRLFSEDRRSGAYALLAASPLSASQIVVGKYLGALGFVFVALACTLHYPFLMMRWSRPDVGILLCNYLAIFLLAASFLAVGVLASSLSSSPVVALLSSFTVLLVLWIMGIGEGALDAGWRDWIADVSMLPHAQGLMRGLLTTVDLVYFVCLIAVLLFASVQSVEQDRWQ
jgi:ABC-2 type transport system permease protein